MGLLAIHLIAASKKGVSSKQLQRMLNVSYKSAWFLSMRIREAMNGSATHQINLTRPIPVVIVYLTVVVLEDGLIHFFDDIYGHDKALQQALAKGYPYPE